MNKEGRGELTNENAAKENSWGQEPERGASCYGLAHGRHLWPLTATKSAPQPRQGVRDGAANQRWDHHASSDPGRDHGREPVSHSWITEGRGEPGTDHLLGK